jgi:molecular chaperone DnaK
MRLKPSPISSFSLRKTVGIDLGTTNSVIAQLDPTDSSLITGQDDQGRCTFPSLVGWHSQHNRLAAGRAVEALAAEGGTNAPTLPLASVKRFMGLPRAFTVGPKQLTPPEVSACILNLLRDMLSRTLNDPRQSIDSAIITIPAYFNHNQIEATRQAGELAGFEVVELLHEPTAAAIYYAWLGHHRDATYLVYDLGGGTFDVSIIRRRLDDYEVLSVSGDPFLGGDDFDRLLATHLIENGAWSLGSETGEARKISTEETRRLFDLSTPAGTRRFAQLVRAAERIKIELTDADHVEGHLPEWILDEQGHALSLETTVERSVFHRLIRDKVDRTIDCCREALARARERRGLTLNDIDYVILVGGSSRSPLVRDTVRAAFCNEQLAERVRNLEPLLHEPDLCVAYGAALRAATHGTRYLFTLASRELGVEEDRRSLELHLTSPVNTREVQHHVAGVVRLGPLLAQSSTLDPLLDGGSVRIRSLATGLTEETFLDERGTFAQEVELQPETDNALEMTVCSGAGEELARVVAVVRHQSEARQLGQGVLPTQLITKPLQIEVLSRSGQRTKQIVAPVGATLPGVFHCTCRTHDQSGSIVVPIFEENRIVKQMIIDDLDPSLPLGSPVEVDFAIDVKHTIEVRVRVRLPSQGASEGDSLVRCETAILSAPPPPSRPTRAEIDEVQRQIEELLPQFSGRVRARLRTKTMQIRQDLFEALRYDDEPKAIQRMAELRELLQQLETSRGQMLDPPWPRFAQLVQHCLSLAAEVADQTGRDPEELREHIRAQERYAEQAYEELHLSLYRECNENLEKYAGYLTQLLHDTLPRPPRPKLSPEEEARAEVERFRAYLSSVWKQVRDKQRADLEARLTEIASQARGLSQRIKSDPVAVLRETSRLGTEVEKVSDLLHNKRRHPPTDDAGLLEGSM